jgi:SAM-dependent MidA family methyltransferase
VFANELLDNLPFRLFVWDGGWREAWVAHETGRFVEVLRPGTATYPLPTDAALGSRVPVQDRARDFVGQARRIASPGAVVLIDYCVPTTAELARRPWRDWLRTYRRHERGDHYLAKPGSQDVTCEVCLDQVLAVAVDEGRRAWGAAAGAPDLQAITMRSRISEAEALLDPAGLGGFSVVTIDSP